MTCLVWHWSQHRPSLIGFASLPSPTYAQQQIEHVWTSIMCHAAGTPVDLLLRAKHLLDSANVGEP